MRSIQGRLLLSTVVGTGLIFTLCGFLLYFLVRSALLTEFDTALAAQARTLATLVEEDEGQIGLELESHALPEFSRAARPEYFELWSADGRVVARSPSLQGRDLAQLSGTLEAPACRATHLPDGRAGHLLGLTFVPRTSEEDESPRKVPILTSATLVVARDTADIDATLSHLRIVLISIGAAGLLASGTLLAIVVRRGLHPARLLAARIAQLSETDLAQPVALPDTPAELLPVVQRLNDLLHRLDAALNREKSFSADVAHELRTPLAGLRATIDVALSQPRDAATYRNALSDTQTITGQLDGLVNNLLSLARLEAGQVQFNKQPVDLADLLQECWKPLADRAAAQHLDVARHVESPCIIATDREKVRQVLQNVLDNAVTYTPFGGRIEILVGPSAGSIGVRVTNSGSQLTSDQVTHVFQRFWRGDVARHATGLHCGLGLSLSQKIMTLLGGSITAESQCGGDFRISLAFGLSR